MHAAVVEVAQAVMRSRVGKAWMGSKSSDFMTRRGERAPRLAQGRKTRYWQNCQWPAARKVSCGGQKLALDRPMLASTTAEKSQACLKWGSGMLLLDGPCVIGRRTDNNLQINNVQVSRRHALLLNLNDDWWVNDLGSRNGVLVNGIRLTNARKLRDGDEIRIANHRLLFCNSTQGPPQHSSIIGKTTQMAPAAPADEFVPPAVLCELIVASAKGEVLEGERAAHWFFGRSLERMPGGEHYLLPLAVRHWLERVVADDGMGATPLELHQGDSRVVLSFARCKGDHYFLLVREDSLKVSAERLQTLGLTEREAEVMVWICEGKKNAEIALILGVTLHTVNRHTEHIFKKLGVDNRQKAIKVALERLGG